VCPQGPVPWPTTRSGGPGSFIIGSAATSTVDTRNQSDMEVT
jgi:hypothetical protein